MSAMAAVRKLPPGVYFSPEPEECLRDYLVPWARSEEPPETGTAIFVEDVYRHGPDELRAMYPPGNARGFEVEHERYFFTRCKYSGSGGRRRVATGGSWKAEQAAKRVEAGGGARRTFGFHRGGEDGRKTLWLMEEFTRDADLGRSKRERLVPVLCRIHASSHASKDEKRAVFGDDGVPFGPDDKLKTAARIVVDKDYFDALAPLLPVSCLRGWEGHGHDAPPPVDLGRHQDQAAPPLVDLGHHQDQAAPPLVDLGHHQDQDPPPLVDLGHHQDQTAPGPAVLDHHHHQPPPPSFHGPQHGEQVIPVGKKARLTYDALALQPQAMDGPVSGFGRHDQTGVIIRRHGDNRRYYANADAAALREHKALPAPLQPPEESRSRTAAEAAVKALAPTGIFDASREAGEALHCSSMDTTMTSFDSYRTGMPWEHAPAFDDVPLPLPCLSFDVPLPRTPLGSDGGTIAGNVAGESDPADAGS